ncbi:MAG: hypothetical protein H7259_01500 [Cytophagales bacterium]|nr:hypothetical protein [Cytophaga sp.]
MNKQALQAIAMLSFSLFILSSCKKDKDSIAPSNAGKSDQSAPAEKIILGEKLENPYTIENMRTAYNNVSSDNNERTNTDESPVRVTHLYLRFLPKDWAEYDVLKSDTTLKLYQIPLDYEIKTYGNVYQDPSIPEGSPTWQYVSVPAEYQYNKTIRHEILSELYLPELDTVLARSSANFRTNGQSFVETLVNEAMVLTKNYSDTIATDFSNARTAFNPNGTVRVFDTRLNQLVPLQGVKMRARRWFDVREATTNADGWYQTSGFKNAANYSLIFEAGAYDVRTGTFGQATIDGPKQSSSWNVDLWDGVNRFYGHVFRGAWRYHYVDIEGLRRPDLGFKLKYAAFDKSGNAQGLNIGNWDVFSINPNILIYRYSSGGNEYASDEIFSTTCHETCHTTHWQVMNQGIIQYSQVNTFIAESWPVAVEWFLTSKEYRSRGILNYGRENYHISASYPLDRAYQYWPLNSNKDYSSVFIDLVDDFNQNQQTYFDNSTLQYKQGINDPVKGYKLADIEGTFLKHVYGQGSLREQLKKNKPTGVTDTQIDLLMDNF